MRSLKLVLASLVAAVLFGCGGGGTSLSDEARIEAAKKELPQLSVYCLSCTVVYEYFESTASFETNAEGLGEGFGMVSGSPGAEPGATVSVNPAMDWATINMPANGSEPAISVSAVAVSGGLQVLDSNGSNTFVPYSSMNYNSTTSSWTYNARRLRRKCGSDC